MMNVIASRQRSKSLEDFTWKRENDWLLMNKLNFISLFVLSHLFCLCLEATPATAVMAEAVCLPVTQAVVLAQAIEVDTNNSNNNINSNNNNNTNPTIAVAAAIPATAVVTVNNNNNNNNATPMPVTSANNNNGNMNNLTVNTSYRPIVMARPVHPSQAQVRSSCDCKQEINCSYFCVCAVFCAGGCSQIERKTTAKQCFHQ